jgi:hypothetical protein
MSLKDAPRLAYLEHQILLRLAQTGALSAAVRDIEREYSLREGQLGSGVFRQTRILSLLFHLVLLPRELLGPVLTLQTVEREWQQWADNLGFSLDLAKFLGDVRNAVAHGDLVFEEEVFRFPKRGETFELSMDELESFLMTVGAALANEAGRLPMAATKTSRRIN